MGTCCSLPDSTPIKIKACFTKNSLENVSYGHQDTNTSKQSDFIGMVPISAPHIFFDCDLKIGDSYTHFIKKLSKVIEEYIKLNDCVLNNERKFLVYETVYGLKTYSFKHNRENTTFNDLFFDLSFVDWSSGYSLIIWFDKNTFSTNLDQAVSDGDVDKIYRLLQISNNSLVYTPGAINSYVELDGAEGEEMRPYPFPIVKEDIFSLLSMNDELITKHLVKQQDICLDMDALLFCIENSCNISKDILIKDDMQCVFDLSPFYVIQWHAKRFVFVYLQLAAIV